MMHSSPRRPFLFAATIAAALLGCEGDGRTPDAAPRAAAGDVGGTVVIAVAAEPDLLLPPLMMTMEAKKASDLLFDHLAEIGPELNTVGDAGFEPRLAEQWVWAPDSLSIAFHLDPKARWHDGAPVRARDVAFTYALYSDPAVGSPHGANVSDIDSVTTPDSLTAVVWFGHRFPEQFFQAVYQMFIVPEHLLGAVPRGSLRTSAFARNPVGTGRFRFARWVPAQTLELVADTANYRGRPKLDRVVWSIAPDYTAATTKLFAGEADFFELLRPEQLPRLASSETLKPVPHVGLDVGLMLFNLRDPGAPSRPHPVFADRAVRRALTMALDREALVRSVFDTLAVVALGPFPRAHTAVDTTGPQLPFDRARARATLDSAGWRDANGDGIREKNGRSLAFSLVVPNSSQIRLRFAVLIQEQLKQVGADVEIDQMEFGTFMGRQARRDFDAVLGNSGGDPSPLTVARQMWSVSAARAKEGSNYGSYENPAFDAAIDSAVVADGAAARSHYRRAHEMIVADAPAVWLYEQKQIAGAHKRLRVTGMRADGWWMGLAEWTIPPEERIARDRIGLRATPEAVAAGPGAAAATASTAGAR